MKNKLMMLCMMLIFFGVSGCAKRENTLPTIDESIVETEKSELEPLIYLTQGSQTNDEEIPWSYNIDPEEKKVYVDRIEWIETETDMGLEAEQIFKVHTTDLLRFSRSDSLIEFSYLNEDGREVEKKFKILSEAIVKDENNKRYEWHSPMR